MKLRSSSSSLHWSFFIRLLAFTSPTVGSSSAQDGLSNLPVLPTGFYEAAATTIGEQEETRFGDLDLGLTLNTLYDSNVTQGNELGLRSRESDFLVQPTLNAGYTVGPGTWQLGVIGSLGRMEYLETNEFNTTVYSAGVQGAYNAGKISASVRMGYRSNGGVNRLAGAFIEQKNFSNSATLRYRLSSKSSAEISWDQQSIESETEGFADTSSNTLRAAALWQATPLIKLGPGFRHGVRTGFQDAEFTVTGPLLRADYRLSGKVNLTSSLGLDFAETPSGDDELFNWQVGLNYRASALWGLSVGMLRDTQATLITGGGFDQISSYRIGYNRKIGPSQLTLGVSYIDRDPQGSSGGALGFRDSNSIDYTASLSFPVFGDEVDLRINLAWRDFTAVDEQLSWDSFQSGLSLAWSF